MYFYHSVIYPHFCWYSLSNSKCAHFTHSPCNHRETCYHWAIVYFSCSLYNTLSNSCWSNQLYKWYLVIMWGLTFLYPLVSLLELDNSVCYYPFYISTTLLSYFILILLQHSYYCSIGANNSIIFWDGPWILMFILQVWILWLLFSRLSEI